MDNAIHGINRHPADVFTKCVALSTEQKFIQWVGLSNLPTTRARMINKLTAWKNTLKPKERRYLNCKINLAARRLCVELIKRVTPQRRRSEQSIVYILVPVETLLRGCFPLIWIFSWTASGPGRGSHLTLAGRTGVHNIPGEERATTLWDIRLSFNETVREKRKADEKNSSHTSLNSQFCCVGTLVFSIRVLASKTNHNTLLLFYSILTDNVDTWLQMIS